jgi:hypothetical protein
MFDMDLIDFDVEENKKNITRLQKIKWRLNSRWPPKIVFDLESTNMHFFQNAFFYRLFLSIFMKKLFLFKSKMAACIEMASLSFLNHPIFKKSSKISNDKYKNFNGLPKK